MINVNDITLTSLDVMTCFDVVTGAYLFTVDELQNASIANTQEKVDIVGKQGRKLNTLKRNKAVTISGANGLVSGGLLELQTGGKFETKTTTVLWVDYLTVTSNAATTSYTAIGTTGAEIETLYTKNADGTIGAQLEQAASASAGKFAYNPETKGLTFSGIEDGTEIVVYYNRQITAPVLENMSDEYSKKCTIYLDASGEDKCGKIYHVQFYIPKADFSGEFTLDIGDNQTVHNFEASALAGACGKSAAMWTYTIFGEDTEDAE